MTKAHSITIFDKLQWNHPDLTSAEDWSVDDEVLLKMNGEDEDIVDYYGRFKNFKLAEYILGLILLPNILFLISLGWIHPLPIIVFLAAPPGKYMETSLASLFLVVFVSEFLAYLHATYVVFGWIIQFVRNCSENDIIRGIYHADHDD